MQNLEYPAFIMTDAGFLVPNGVMAALTNYYPENSTEVAHLTGEPRNNQWFCFQVSEPKPKQRTKPAKCQPHERDGHAPGQPWNKKGRRR